MSQDNVHLMWPSLDVPTALRNIADDIKAAIYPNTTATLIIDSEVLGIGKLKHDGDAAMNAIWDCNFAIAKLMRAATGGL